MAEIDVKKELRRAHEAICEVEKALDRVNDHVNVMNTPRDGYRDPITGDLLTAARFRKCIEKICDRFNAWK